MTTQTETTTETTATEPRYPVCDACNEMLYGESDKCMREACGGTAALITRAEYDAAKITLQRRRLHNAWSTLYNLHERARWADASNTNAHEISARLWCMRDLAELLGGESMRSFTHCCERLAVYRAITLQRDSAPFSLCWQGAGMFGGFIFHSSDRTWGLHT
jgi:hypothetical protein